mgnify:FL=1
MLKTRLKKCSIMTPKYHWSIVEAMVIIILLTAFFLFGVFLRGIVADREMASWKSFVLRPEPEICALCGSGIPYHAPVLVNLSTGEAGEIRVYDPDPRHRYELAEEQSTGTFSLLHIAGAAGYRDTSNHTCYVTLPERESPIDPALFCRDCRALLADTATEGYILADLYNLRDMKVYAIKDNVKYTIRDYDISISTRTETGGLSINVTGLLFTSEG